MTEQIGVALDFFAFFTASKVGKTGLTVNVVVRDRVGSVIQASTLATEVGGGLYRYTLASGSNTAEGMYLAVFSTADTTVDQKDLPALWPVGKGGLEHLDVDVSSRNAVTPNTIAPNNAGIGTLLADATALLADVATLLARLSDARATLLDLLPRLDVNVSTRATAADVNAGTGDPLENPVPGAYVAGSAGYALSRVGLLGTGITAVMGPSVSDGGLIRLVQGDTYDDAEGRALQWTSADWPSLVDASVHLVIDVSHDYPCTVVGQLVTLEMSAEVTRGLLGRYQYRLVATLPNTDVVTLTRGVILVERV